MSLEKALEANTAATLALADLMQRLSGNAEAVGKGLTLAAKMETAAGNAASGAGAASPAASTASSTTSVKSADKPAQTGAVDTDAVMAEAKKLTVDLVNGKGRAVAEGVLTSFGLTKTSACPADKIVALRDALKAALQAEESLA